MSENIFEALREDHERQRELLGKLADTQGDSESRRALHRDLVRELQAHADAEERAFYAFLLAHTQTQDQAGHSIEEHKELEDLMEELADIDRSSPAWLRKFGQLRERTEHHLREEEHVMFQLAGKVLSDQQKTELAAHYRREKRAEMRA